MKLCYSDKLYRKHELAVLFCSVETTPKLYGQSNIIAKTIHDRRKNIHVICVGIGLSFGFKNK